MANFGPEALLDNFQKAEMKRKVFRISQRLTGIRCVRPSSTSQCIEAFIASGKLNALFSFHAIIHSTMVAYEGPFLGTLRKHRTRLSIEANFQPMDELSTPSEWSKLMEVYL